ncbi:CBU_0592 family membrane protein [Sphingomonas profundi]|uniref:CBU_0592 family membrane protein n=1 Tax=Alterirhizorhabdus profundi TaxID=2681549 RepID=UPI0012E932CE|nr:hypothetical protein [Sphingomonas profundi]
MLIEFVGWAGSVTMLIAYALLSTGRLSARSFVYQAMNIGGAVGMIANSWSHGALPSVFTSVIWMAVGAMAIGQRLREPRLPGAIDRRR